jgi:hypothetical protein
MKTCLIGTDNAVRGFGAASTHPNQSGGRNLKEGPAFHNGPFANLNLRATQKYPSSTVDARRLNKGGFVQIWDHFSGATIPQGFAPMFRKDYELSAAQHAAIVLGKSEPQSLNECSNPKSESPAVSIPGFCPPHELF